MRPWMDRIANARPYVFQQDSAPRQGQDDAGAAAQHCHSPLVAGLVAALPTELQPHRIHFFWGVVEAKTKQNAHNTVDSPRAAIVEEFVSYTLQGYRHQGVRVISPPA